MSVFLPERESRKMDMGAGYAANLRQTKRLAARKDGRKHALVAQLAEHRPSEPRAAGSRPVQCSIARVSPAFLA